MLPPKLPRFCDHFLPKRTDSKFNAFPSGGFEKASGTRNQDSVAITSLPAEGIGSKKVCIYTRLGKKGLKKQRTPFFPIKLIAQLENCNSSYRITRTRFPVRSFRNSMNLHLLTRIASSCPRCRLGTFKVNAYLDNFPGKLH